jgi:hypothetical protein
VNEDNWPLIYEDPKYSETHDERHARLVDEYIKCEGEDEALGLLNQIRDLAGMDPIEKSKFGERMGHAA